LLAISGDPALQRQAAEIWASDKFSETDSVPQVWHSKHDKIRIAYFSADFRNHPVAILMAGMYENHDKSQFELIGFSFTHERDEMTARLENAFDQFIDVQNLSDQEIVELARMLEIDIAVDLGGYTGDGGSACFAMRVAPIQISYLGYSGTMGVNYIDYLLADEFLIPKTSQQYYSEKMIYLPDCYLVNDNTRKISNHKFCRQELGLPETGFVFCCFNNEYKYTPTTFSCWMRILNQVKDSVLWLAEGNPFVAENLRQAAIQQGISAARLIFARRLPDIGQHLARQRLADLFLDTLPYNAHTTSCDALWAGLPVLTCAGEVYAARVAASLLNAMNLPELITARMEDYEARAIELATQPEKLRAIKAKLALNRLRAPLFDTPLFTRHIETAFFEVHARFRGGLTPEHVYIQKQESAGNSQPGYV
jgi:predicted O-linked N-acetylglucosamine transferase (SPINDLY family)